MTKPAGRGATLLAAWPPLPYVHRAGVTSAPLAQPNASLAAGTDDLGPPQRLVTLGHSLYRTVRVRLGGRTRGTVEQYVILLSAMPDVADREGGSGLLSALSESRRMSGLSRQVLQHVFLHLRPALTSLQRLAGVGKVEMTQLSEPKTLEMSVASAVSSSRVCRE